MLILHPVQFIRRSELVAAISELSRRGVEKLSSMLKRKTEQAQAACSANRPQAALLIL